MEAMTRVEVREAARAVVLDPDDRILLVRWVNEDNGVDTWLTPGGGIEYGEDAAAALRRELREETGLETFEPGPTIWTRRHSFPWYDRTVDQRETFTLVRVPAFEPRPIRLPSTPRVFAPSAGGRSRSSRPPTRRSPRAASPRCCASCSSTEHPPSRSTPECRFGACRGLATTPSSTASARSWPRRSWTRSLSARPTTSST